MISCLCSPRLLLSSLLLSSLAFAQEPTASEVSTTTPLGILLVALVGVGGLAIIAAFSALGLFFSKKAGDGAAWGLANRLWLAMQNAVSHAEAELRPSLQKALADGKLTAEEAAELKARTIAIFKTIAGDLLAQAPKVLGFDPAGMPTFLSGMLERAVASMKAAQNQMPERIPSATEAAKVVADARANPPAAAPATVPQSGP